MAQESAQNVPSNTPPNASFDAASLDDDFELAEKRFAAKYEVLEKLGEGTYGSVFKAREKRTGGAFAMKIMKLGSGEDGVPSTAIREIAVLKELSHANVVRLLDVFCKPAKLVLVFEYLENDLKKYMKSLGGRLHMKIADFGLARAFSLPLPIYTHEVVTVWYRPPEILLGSQLYSIPVDTWGVGCILAEMATGLPLFCGDSEIDTIFKVFQKLGTPTEEIWPGLSALPDFKATFPKWPTRSWASIRNTKAQVGTEGIDLLENLLVYDPQKRLSARHALNHVYFKDVDRSTLATGPAQPPQTSSSTWR